MAILKGSVASALKFVKCYFIVLVWKNIIVPKKTKNSLNKGYVFRINSMDRKLVISVQNNIRKRE